MTSMEKLTVLIDCGGAYMGSCLAGYVLWWNGEQEWHVSLDEVINQTYEKWVEIETEMERENRDPMDDFIGCSSG